ncbi:acyl-coenzyme A:6-aminopenicillanic acid acyl-transferase-domain-containing protein [Halenospora varia]|nr:acyl-coenzyme A:6-aminopenicillanic acid acyl-transferase-domain-containing protein [Halenospora varia]
MIKQISCQGTPYEIGFKHGTEAATEIHRSITFYTSMFLIRSKKSWPEVLDVAKVFEKEISSKWPRYHEEMRGIAEGSKRSVEDIVAINCRTEIAFGLFSDGCTSLFWETEGACLLGQNWDWNPVQKPNLIALTITQATLPTIKIITEAGLIGKIGLNSSGVGVCFNAIRAPGLNYNHMPAHLGLRTVLECTSAKEAVETLEKEGMASSAHMLIADGKGEAVGLEFTKDTFARIMKDSRGRVVHSNHLLKEHKGFEAPQWMEDSPQRVERMSALTEKFAEEPSWDEFSDLFKDEDGLPGAICRKAEGYSDAATLFNIVMDLRVPRAVVKMGRPNEDGEVIELGF